ncbi:hypothetical protein PCANC_10606 [Puccinia coronata f. sp. avenae]|uniref:Uracil-DNA glycosylase-like domain-containing protein n=1 Tax=Puccinia coronata f. sp. avenae TaxID=200324 RepID=A0A2N5VR59_9BASI|nr:hypothetical protein PCANC_10606 [Puccinia coronata f. sp. avenae]
MAPAAAPKPDKRQRSIAQMFGAKDPAFAAAASNKASSTNASSSRTTALGAKSKGGKTLTVRTLMTAGRLARIAYQKLQPVDAASYRDTLSVEFKELLALELDPDHGLGASYLHVLRAQLTQQYFLDLKRFLIAEGINQPHNNHIYPSPNNIYHWSRATPLHKIRVVIIGQDPYHGPGQAHGLSFSVPKGIPIPGSLRNIYQELKREYPHFKPPPHGTLRAWADSGVLLLNTSLTVKKGCAGSHSNKGWEQFTDAVVDAIDLYGGLGLLDIPHSGEGEEQALDEPASKRVKVDHPASEDAPPCEPRPPQADQDSQKSTGSISDTNAAPSVADPNLGSSSVPELKKQPPDDKPTSADPHPSPSTNTKQCDDSQSVPSPAETNPQAEPLEAAGTEAQATSKMPAGEIKAYAAPGFGKGVVFLCWGKWAADRVARLSDSKHLILKSAHPSPLSAHRGFLGNNHFKLANEWLENKYGAAAKVDWCDLKP